MSELTVSLALHYSAPTIRDAEGRAICDMIFGTDEERANTARLFIASPLMFAALEEVEAAWSGNGDMATAVDSALLAIEAAGDASGSGAAPQPKPKETAIGAAALLGVLATAKRDMAGRGASLDENAPELVEAIEAAARGIAALPSLLAFANAVEAEFGEAFDSDGPMNGGDAVQAICELMPQLRAARAAAGADRPAKPLPQPSLHDRLTARGYVTDRVGGGAAELVEGYSKRFGADRVFVSEPTGAGVPASYDWDAWSVSIVRDGHGDVWGASGKSADDLFDALDEAEHEAGYDRDCKCGNCDWTGPESALQPIQHLSERVSAGETMPAGECPKCGALAHLIEGEGLN